MITDKDFNSLQKGDKVETYFFGVAEVLSVPINKEVKLKAKNTGCPYFRQYEIKKKLKISTLSAS